MHHNAVLRWAAGADLSLPKNLELNEEILIDLVGAHNLSGRLLKRLTDGEYLGFSPRFGKALKELHSETKRQVTQNMRITRLVREQLPSTAGMITIKGFCTYVLLGQETVMRSGDIDVISDNTDALVSTLKDMGYLQTRAPFMHEIGEYTKDDIEIDVQSYFPVYAFSSALRGDVLSPYGNPGIWRQDYTTTRREITHDLLSRHMYQGNTADTRGITIADANMLSIIICAHAFMNYINLWSISHRKKAYVRLGELADLTALVSHPTFDKNIFLSLVELLDARDAVEWAAATTSLLLGKNFLPIPSRVAIDGELPSARFPRCLWWHFWAALPSKRNELIQTQWLSMNSLIQAIGGGNLLLMDHGSTGRYATTVIGNSRQLLRFITQKADPIPVLLEVRVSADGVTVDLEVTSEATVGTDRVRVDFGYVASEWVHSVGSHVQSIVGDSADVSFRENSTGYTIQMSYSWQTLGHTAQQAKEIALLIGVGKQTDGDGLSASCLIPLVVRFLA